MEIIEFLKSDIAAAIANFSGMVALVIVLANLIWTRGLSQLLNKDREEVQINLLRENGRQKLSLPLPIRRQDLSRQEIAGMIGMFCQGQRFQIPQLADVFMTGAVAKARRGSLDEIDVVAPDEWWDLIANNLSAANAF